MVDLVAGGKLSPWARYSLPRLRSFALLRMTRRAPGLSAGADASADRDGAACARRPYHELPRVRSLSRFATAPFIPREPMRPPSRHRQRLSAGADASADRAVKAEKWLPGEDVQRCGFAGDCFLFVPWFRRATARVAPTGLSHFNFTNRKAPGRLSGRFAVQDSFFSAQGVLQAAQLPQQAPPQPQEQPFLLRAARKASTTSAPTRARISQSSTLMPAAPPAAGPQRPRSRPRRTASAPRPGS